MRDVTTTDYNEKVLNDYTNRDFLIYKEHLLINLKVVQLQEKDR